MSHTALPLPRGKYPPFLPSNFYEAPQYSAYARQPPASKQTAGNKASADSPVKAKRTGRPPIIHTNSLKPYLQGYSSPGHALVKLPLLADIVTGAVNLDYGDNAKPLSMKTALILLRQLDVISSKAVMAYMELSLRSCCERHAQRLALCIRIIEQAARSARSKWDDLACSAPSDSYAAVHRIVPCGEQHCSVCRTTVELEHAWSLPMTEHDESTDPFETSMVFVAADDNWLDLKGCVGLSD